MNTQEQAEIYELRQRLDKAERILEDCGFRRCTAAACNCNGYHGDGPRIPYLLGVIRNFRELVWNHHAENIMKPDICPVCCRKEFEWVLNQATELLGNRGMPYVEEKP